MALDSWVGTPGPESGQQGVVLCLSPLQALIRLGYSGPGVFLVPGNSPQFYLHAVQVHPQTSWATWARVPVGPAMPGKMFGLGGTSRGVKKTSRFVSGVCK